MHPFGHDGVAVFGLIGAFEHMAAMFDVAIICASQERGLFGHDSLDGPHRKLAPNW